MPEIRQRLDEFHRSSHPATREIHFGTQELTDAFSVRYERMPTPGVQFRATGPAVGTDVAMLSIHRKSHESFRVTRGDDRRCAPSLLPPPRIAESSRVFRSSKRLPDAWLRRCPTPSTSGT